MKTIKKTILFLLLLSISHCVFAQNNSKTHTFKKGEILDILLIGRKPNKNEAYKTYRETAVKIAMKKSFKIVKAIGIKENIHGKLEPNVLIIGKWDNLIVREKFLENIYKDIPDFDEQRKNIFSFLKLTYFEMQKDITFSIDKNKYNVATAYWKKDKTLFEKLMKQLKNESNKNGGKTIIELTNGKSPFKYYYLPDYLIITEWDNKADFEKFNKKNIQMDTKGLLNVNQFILR